MDFELELDRLRIRVRPMSRFVHLLARKLQQPVLDRAPDVAGFRFSNPTLIHFCLLRAVRIVSSLNASIELARYGYSQEIGVLLRTTIEYDTQIDFMVASLDGNGHLSSDAKAFITGYFVDTHRPPRTATKIAKLIQKKIHDQIGARLDKAPIQSDDGKSASDRLSNVYRIFSNYVHGRYPETMDMYGGGHRIST